MNEQLKKLLKSLGFTADQIATLGDEEKSKDVKVADLVGEVNTRMRTALENDSDFVDKIHGSVRAEVLTSKERKIMKLFPKATKEVIESLPKNRQFDALLEFLQENYVEAEDPKGKKTPDDKDKEILRLTTELGEVKNKVKDYEEKIIPEANKKADDYIDNYRKDDIIRKKLSGMKLIVGVDVAHPIVIQKLSERWDAKLNDSKNDLTLFQKGKDLKAIKNTKEVVLDEELDEIITSLELKQVSNGGKTPPGGGGAGGGGDKGAGGGGGTNFMQERADKAKEHAASMFGTKKE